MKVGVLGSGDVATILAAGFHRHGHEVRLGTRDPARLAGWVAEHPGSSVGDFADAATFGEVVVLAVKGSVALDALALAGASNLAGKTVIDVTNPISDAPPVNGVLRFYTDLNRSQLEILQHAFPEANFVKAFNSVGGPVMVNPQFAEGLPTMFICGNDGHAKQTVSGLLTQFGWDAQDLGHVEAARAIEPLCMLWCIPGFLDGQWNHAFKLVRPAA
ncbi:hypothetical protein SAMN02745857_01045 [Andreprevotia lacus DSM 23236]|uniref:Pyrroline-5-carboxylate reductase catalytic N-terminal domain-containing protein n=1 Tax=Andreprevotia lacus DSM 23236 TaxID=1121001 RepID=A0A1W1XB80_9NEIS|nr:NAD(P)-binding domain-containing protein [Andreprevotia lacus]SMC20781.1 hypothetical protein SAMN02745857_01045 [Andreprevotia lacus DSM 23236]